VGEHLSHFFRCEPANSGSCPALRDVQRVRTTLAVTRDAKVGKNATNYSDISIPVGYLSCGRPALSCARPCRRRSREATQGYYGTGRAGAGLANRVVSASNGAALALAEDNALSQSG
jgi:hypothetical protein